MLSSALLASFAISGKGKETELDVSIGRSG